MQCRESFGKGHRQIDTSQPLKGASRGFCIWICRLEIPMRNHLGSLDECANHMGFKYYSIGSMVLC